MGLGDLSGHCLIWIFVMTSFPEELVIWGYQKTQTGNIRKSFSGESSISSRLTYLCNKSDCWQDVRGKTLLMCHLAIDRLVWLIEEWYNCLAFGRGNSPLARKLVRPIHAPIKKTSSNSCAEKTPQLSVNVKTNLVLLFDHNTMWYCIYLDVWPILTCPAAYLLPLSKLGTGRLSKFK